MQTLMAPCPEAALARTATVGEFAAAINSAEPSPDGRWLCVLCDAAPGEAMQVPRPFFPHCSAPDQLLDIVGWICS